MQIQSRKKEIDEMADDFGILYDDAELLYNEGYCKREWFDAKTNPPKESGEVLVFTKGGVQAVLNYSVRHKAFNAFDDFMYAENAIEVTHWMPLLPDPKGE